MFSIIMPMITPVVFTKLAASKEHNLLSESIAAVGCIMKHMPWSKYSHVLKNYLKILQKDVKNQRHTIRLGYFVFIFLKCLSNWKELEEIDLPYVVRA